MQSYCFPWIKSMRAKETDGKRYLFLISRSLSWSMPGDSLDDRSHQGVLRWYKSRKVNVE